MFSTRAPPSDKLAPKFLHNLQVAEKYFIEVAWKTTGPKFGVNQTDRRGRMNSLTC